MIISFKRMPNSIVTASIFLFIFGMFQLCGLHHRQNPTFLFIYFFLSVSFCLEGSVGAFNKGALALNIIFLLVTVIY